MPDSDPLLIRIDELRIWIRCVK